MKYGDKIRVYEDPITRLKAEGIARLIEPVKQDNGDLSIWIVEFAREPGEYYQRTVNKNDLIIKRI